MEKFTAARAAVLQAERNLAAAKGEQYAVPIEFPVSWDTGAPLPHLLQNDHRTILTFFLRTLIQTGTDHTHRCGTLTATLAKSLRLLNLSGVCVRRWALRTMRSFTAIR